MQTLYLFSNTRSIKSFFAENYAESLLPHAKNVGEFLDSILYVRFKRRIPAFLRSVYLYQALVRVDISPLGTFGKNFTQFLKNSDFFLKFYDELCAECVKIESLKKLDTYAFYDDHLQILEQVFSNYQEILQKEKFFDQYFLEDYQIAFEFLAEFQRIIFYVAGFLSRFEMRIFKEISCKIPIIFNLNIDNFNRSYYSKIFNLELNLGGHEILLEDSKFQILSYEEPRARHFQIQTLEFQDRISEVGGVFAQIDLWLAQGVLPEEICVILPNENFVEYLQLFDRVRNFNFAMGHPITATNLYLLIQKSLEQESDLMFQDLSAFEEFLRDFEESKKESQNVKKAFLDTLEVFKFSLHYLNALSLREKILVYLELLKDIVLDDVGGGRIRVIGILETRGMKFSHIIIPEFNATNVPTLNDKDIFLNSKIREEVGLPTRQDRENLQKHYYAKLIANSKEVRILCLNNDEEQPSHFLLEDSIFNQTPMLKAHLDYSAYFLSGEPLVYKERKIIAPLETKTWSATHLRCFLLCKRKFYYSYILGFKESGESAHLGLQVHEVLAQVYAEAQNERNFDTNRLFQKVSQKFQSMEFQSAQELFDVALAQKRLQGFFKYEEKRLEREHWIPTDFERNFSFSLEGFIFHGRIDRIDRRGNEIFVLDYKYKRNVENDSNRNPDKETDFQLPIYYLAAKELYPHCEIQAGFYDICGADIKLESNVEYKIEILKDKLQSIQENADATDFSLRERMDECRNCEFIYLCNRHKSVKREQ